MRSWIRGGVTGPRSQYAVREWREYQTGRGPYLTLHRRLLDDPRWHSLSGTDAKLLVMLLLLATDYDGDLPDTDEIAFRLRTTKAAVERALPALEHWIRQPQAETPKDAPDIQTKPDTTVCPQKEIIEAYHRELPMLRQVRVWNGEREKHLRARWREAPERQSLDWWVQFFRYIAKSDFLCGRSGGDRPFQADLAWIVRPTNFAKIIEGKYEN